MKYFDLSQSVVYIYIAMFLLAMGITIFSIPNIIFVAKKKRLLDKPDHRKKHVNVTPNLGGIGIFSAFIFVASIFNVGFYFTGWNCILGASFLLFVTGLKDDLVAILYLRKPATAPAMVKQSMADPIFLLIAKSTPRKTKSRKLRLPARPSTPSIRLKALVTKVIPITESKKLIR